MKKLLSARGVTAMLLAAASVCLLTPVIVYYSSTAAAEQSVSGLKRAAEAAVSASPEAEPVPLAFRQTERAMLPEMAALYAKNTDIAAWIEIPGTNVDYPVMRTPDDEEYYLYRSFTREDSKSGTPFADTQSGVDGRNLTVYAHNMKAGTMFHDITRYADGQFFAEHRYIELTTLFERRRYEVVSAFHTRVYAPDDDAFRYYAYAGIDTQRQFDEFANAVTLLSEFQADTRIEPNDMLLTLSTCSYHAENGRFVVVARKIS